jgi:hypothetical protein
MLIMKLAFLRHFGSKQGMLLLGVVIGAGLMVVGVAVGAHQFRPSAVTAITPSQPTSSTAGGSLSAATPTAAKTSAHSVASAKPLSSAGAKTPAPYPCANALGPADSLYKTMVSSDTQKVVGEVQMQREGAHSLAEAGRPPDEFIAAINGYYKAGNAALNTDYQNYLNSLAVYGNLSQPCKLDLGPPTLFPASFTGPL